MMNVTEFQKKLQQYTSQVNEVLENYLDVAQTQVISPMQNKIFEAMRYSLMAGGKRLRPALCMSVAELFMADTTSVMPYAVAIEMIHTYSLIHDDLPCMDDDDYRRNRLTCHKVFGEACAVLAGDGLLTMAFEILNDRACVLNNSNDLTIAAHNRAANEISRCAGCRGMIGGQIIDMEADESITEHTLNQLQSLKTGALIRASIMSSAYLLDVSTLWYDALEKYAFLLGRSFQITDDILDAEGEAEELGKTPGKDLAEGKATYVTLYGLEKAKQEAERLTEEMKQILYDAVKAEATYHADDVKPTPKRDISFLVALADFVNKRKS